MNLQGDPYNLQGGSGYELQSAPNTVQIAPNLVQNPAPIDLQGGSTAPPQTLGATTAPAQFDPEAAARAAAAAKAAEDARRAATLRGEVTNLVNTIKDIFNSRYGMVDVLAGEQSGKLNERFGTESQDLTNQIEGENQRIGAAHAASGTFDSSYRGNNVDTVTRAGEAQIRDLGEELRENVAKIAAWVSGQKTSFDAQKGGYDAIVARLAEETDPGRLTDLRNTLDSRIAEVRGGQADYYSQGQHAQSLASIAPSSARAVQLKTTLSQILAGNADASQKKVIGERLISSAGLNPDEQQSLLLAFQSDLNKPIEQAQPA